MPTSDYRNIPKIVEIILFDQPKKILDIGFGFGKYGFLSREYLSTWNKEKIDDNLVIDGIEIYKKYISDLQKNIYNKIYVENIMKIFRKIKKRYDLVLCIDVLEHLPKAEGKKLLKKIYENNKSVLISTPINPSQQGIVFGNKYESHISKWTKKDFKFTKNLLILQNRFNYIVYYNKNLKRIGDLKKNLIKKSTKEFFLKIPYLHQIYRYFKKNR